jgi:hypothetical protein
MTWFKIQKNIRVEYRPPHKKTAGRVPVVGNFGAEAVLLQYT